MSIDVVRDFYHEARPNYLILLRTVEAICKELEAKLGKHVVVRVYTRADKQNGNEPLKELEKVYAACPRPVNRENLRSVQDIIGVTVVVQYPDQIESTLDKIRAKLVEKGIRE